MKNRKRHLWTSAEVAVLRQRYPHEDTDQLAAFFGLRVGQLHYQAARIGIVKSPEFIRALKLKAANAVRDAGKDKRFVPGQVPWNKGLRYEAGGRSRETRFKAGHLPKNYRPLGSERLSDGFWQRKITETGYPPKDWVPIHHLVWRDAGREIPAGYALCFRDGNRGNFDIENFELVSRKDLMARNSVHNAGPEIARLQQLRGALMREINQRTKDCHE